MGAEVRRIALCCSMLSLTAYSRGYPRPHRRGPSLRPRPWSYRRLGVAGAIFALVVQLTLPFAPMPASQDRAPTALEEAIALWGPDSLCTTQGYQHGSGDRQDGKLACDQCPICQAQHHLAQLLPPPRGGLTPPSWSPVGMVLADPSQIWFGRIVTHHRSRAPPIALT